MTELKPCPFCGGEAIVFVSNSVVVMCKKCHCQTFPRADGCIAEAERNNALESVINAWNTRPIQSVVVKGNRMPTFADLTRKADEMKEAAERMLQATKELKEVVSKSWTK